MTRAAMAFALQKLGRNYVARLVDFLSADDLRQQVQEYLIELGAPIEKDLLPQLQEPDEVDSRRASCEVLGAIGGEPRSRRSQGLKDKDKIEPSASAVERAVERIKMRRKR